MSPSCALLGGFAVGARVALLWQHYGNAWQSPAVIRQAHRTPHACRTRTLRIRRRLDAPAACAVLFRPCSGGVVTRTRNVSEYMLVLALCLVSVCGSLRQIEPPAVWRTINILFRIVGLSRVHWPERGFKRASLTPTIHSGVTNGGQVVHTPVQLSPSSILWYGSNGGDSLWLPCKVGYG